MQTYLGMTSVVGALLGIGRVVCYQQPYLLRYVGITWLFEMSDVKTYQQRNTIFSRYQSGQTIIEFAAFLAFICVLIALMTQLYAGGKLSPQAPIQNEFSNMYNNLNNIQENTAS